MEKAFVPGKSKVHYSGPFYDEAEIKAVNDTLRDGWLVSGPKVRAFEEKLSGYIGVNDVVAVNSGSSANLLSIACLSSPTISGNLKRGDEVVTSALTFPTTLNPIIQYGLTPVFVDVDDSLNMDLYQTEKAITPKTRALMALHFLGNPINMKHLLEIAERHDLFVIEDCCDGLGSTFRERKIGGFGDLGTFSFYPAHHITTLGEGGAISVNREEYSPVLRSLRDWGRACACPVCKVTTDHDYTCPLRHKTDVPDLKGYDKRYLYTEIGYNLKMIEVQGAVGLVQLEKHDQLTLRRRKNVDFYESLLSKFDSLFLPSSVEGGEANWFAFPIVVKPDTGFSRNEIITWLEMHNIETRPLFAGNILSHPAYEGVKYKTYTDLVKTNWARDSGFFIGCYAGIGKAQREYVAQVFEDFLNKHIRHCARNVRLKNDLREMKKNEYAATAC